MAAKKEKILLAIDYSTNWYSIFKNLKTKSGETIRVEQAEWKDIHVEASSEKGVIVFCKKADEPFPFSTQKEDRSFSPDFVLIRNFPSDLHGNHFKNTLIGLMFNNLPGVNSLESVYRCMERPLVYAELLKASKKLGDDGFQLIPMIYHPNSRLNNYLITPEKYPAVIKVSSTHAGYGKLQAKDLPDLKDVRSVLALTNDYYTIEGFQEHEYEFRIQKIGNHYRSFRRNSDSHWKNNWGNLQFVDHPWQEKYKKWIDEVAQMFGGLDIASLDVLHTKDGKDVVLELNDTAGGLMFEHENEDLGHIRDLIIEKMSTPSTSSTSKDEKPA